MSKAGACKKHKDHCVAIKGMRRRTTSARSDHGTSKRIKTSTRVKGLIPAASLSVARRESISDQQSKAFPRQVRYPQLVALLSRILHKERVGSESVCEEVAEIAVRGLLGIIRKALTLRRPVNLLRVCSLTPYRRRKTTVYSPARDCLISVPSRWAVRYVMSHGLKQALNPSSVKKH